MHQRSFIEIAFIKLPVLIKIELYDWKNLKVSMQKSSITTNVWVFICLIIIRTTGMELTPEQQKKRKEMEIPAPAEETDPIKRVKLPDDKSLETLPFDLLINIVTAGSTPKEVSDTVASLMRTNKKFRDILNGQVGTQAIIASLARKFFHHDQFQAAKVLNTAASRAWLKNAINPDIQKRIQELLKNNAVAVGNLNLNSIISFLDSQHADSETTLKERFFSSAPARIWLIKKILERIPFNRVAALEQIKSQLLPNTIDPDLDEWINFTKKHMTAKIADLVRAGKSTELKKLIDQGIDVSQNLLTASPFIFSAQDAATLRLLIAAGADVNAVQPGRSNSILHGIINVDVDDESINKKKSLANPDNQNALLKVRALLESGANPNLKNALQQTPLALVNQKKLRAEKYGITDDPFLRVLENTLKKYGAKE